MDTRLGNQVIEDGAQRLGAIGSVTQRLPVVWRHLREGVFNRLGARDKGREQVGAQLVAQSHDPVRDGGRIDAVAGATGEMLGGALGSQGLSNPGGMVTVASSEMRNDGFCRKVAFLR